MSKTKQIVLGIVIVLLTAAVLCAVFFLYLLKHRFRHFLVECPSMPKKTVCLWVEVLCHFREVLFKILGHRIYCAARRIKELAEIVAAIASEDGFGYIKVCLRTPVWRGLLGECQRTDDYRRPEHKT